MKKDILFITGNEHKLSEARAILDGYHVVGKDIDIDEIQSLDPRAVIRHKVESAYQIARQSCFVEDVSIVFEALGKLPGPFIKFFLAELGSHKTAELVHKYDNHRAHVLCTIGYADTDGAYSFHEGRISGEIVLPQGESGFGFDPIFVADGQEKTFAELPDGVKNTMSQRYLALQELKKFLSTEGGS